MPMTLSSYPNWALKRLRFSADVQQLSVGYRLLRFFTWVVLCALWRVRVFNRRHEPADGGVLYVSNHQSFLDPPLVAFALQRPMNFMARDSLFRFGPFRWLIESLNAFPVRPGKASVAALREGMRRLKHGRQILVFPEGTRTWDGRIGPFLPGVTMLAQRAARWTVPVVIDGAFECWPRWKNLPGLGSIVIRYGRPVPQEEARKHSPAAFANLLRARIIEMQTEVRRGVGRAPLHYADEQALSADQ